MKKWHLNDEGFLEKLVVQDMFRNPYNYWDGETIEALAREVLVLRNENKRLRTEKNDDDLNYC